jgi:outer membrane lipoprotein-sorting protein
LKKSRDGLVRGSIHPSTPQGERRRRPTGLRYFVHGEVYPPPAAPEATRVSNHERYARCLPLTGILKTALVLSLVWTLAASCLGRAWADPWEDMRASAGKITSVRGEFTQTRHMKILSRPLVSAGVFLFQAPDSLRWEYRSPFRSILLAHEGKTRRFVQKDDRLVADDSASLPAMQMVVQEIGQWLKGRFDENPAFAASLEPGRKIRLAPKEPSFAAVIQRIEIVLSDREGVVESVTIYESPDSFTKMEFSQVTLNQPMDASLFREP